MLLEKKSDMHILKWLVKKLLTFSFDKSINGKTWIKDNHLDFVQTLSLNICLYRNKNCLLLYPLLWIVFYLEHEGYLFFIVLVAYVPIPDMASIK